MRVVPPFISAELKAAASVTVTVAWLYTLAAAKTNASA